MTDVVGEPCLQMPNEFMIANRVVEVGGSAQSGSPVGTGYSKGSPNRWERPSPTVVDAGKMAELEVRMEILHSI